VLGSLVAAKDFRTTPVGREFILELVRQIGARADELELSAVAREIAVMQGVEGTLAHEMLIALLSGAGPKRPAVRKVIGAIPEIRLRLAGLAEQSAQMAANEEVSIDGRQAHIEAMALVGDFEDLAPRLAEFLAPRHPQAVQSSALATLGQFNTDQVATIILDAWTGLSPALRQEAANVLTTRTESANALLAAVESGALSARDFDPSTIQRLKTHPAAAVRDKASKLLVAVNPKRAEVVEGYLDVLQLVGDVGRGREVFKKNCAICHRKEGVGTEVGADLVTVVTRTPEALLISILDPNREVDPKYLQYTVLTADGLAKSGMIAGETATSITLKREEGVTETVPRADIESIQSTGMTLMPEGLEKVIDKQSLADLIAYLRDR
jgi:putative heme-binding domain-containing protein